MNRFALLGTLVLGLFLSQASSFAATAEQEQMHQNWLQKIAEKPSLVSKGENRHPFSDSNNKLRCWVAGFAEVVGYWGGVCRGGGKKYSFFALDLGLEAGISAARLTLTADNAFLDHEIFEGAHFGAYTGLGGEAYEIKSLKGRANVEGKGFGIGAEVVAGYTMVWLDEI